MAMWSWGWWPALAAMTVVVGYHLARGARGWLGGGPARPLSDLWHAAMAAGMALMIVGVTGSGAGWWLLGFAIPVAVLAWRSLDRYVVGGVAAAGHELRQLAAGVAMCWMLAVPMVMTMPAGPAVPVAVEGAVGGALAGHGHQMAGMATGGIGSGIDPVVLAVLVRFVTAVMLLVVALLAARTCLALLRRWRAGRAGAAGMPSRSASAPASWQGCQLAMHVTAGLMLAAMV